MKYNDFLKDLKNKEAIEHLFKIFGNCCAYDFLPLLSRAIEFRIEDLEQTNKMFTQRYLTNDGIIISVTDHEIKQLQNLKDALRSINVSKFKEENVREDEKLNT